jgi:hypothetical protein
MGGGARGVASTATPRILFNRGMAQEASTESAATATG